MNCIFNKDPDRISETSHQITSFYSEFIYKQGTNRRGIFSKIES